MSTCEDRHTKITFKGNECPVCDELEKEPVERGYSCKGGPGIYHEKIRHYDEDSCPLCEALEEADDIDSTLPDNFPEIKSLGDAHRLHALMNIYEDLS